MATEAVCVGINDYSPRCDCQSLPDARPDGEAWAQILPNAFGFDASAITLITDGSATRQAVLSALTNVLQQSGSDDVAGFFLAGHGGRIQLSDGTYFETIRCSDPGGDVSDREINTLAAALSPSKVNYTLVLDTCYSGGVLDPVSQASGSVSTQLWKPGSGSGHGL